MLKDTSRSLVLLIRANEEVLPEGDSLLIYTKNKKKHT